MGFLFFSFCISRVGFHLSTGWLSSLAECLNATASLNIICTVDRRQLGWDGDGDGWVGRDLFLLYLGTEPG